jgi:hypothetical protein
MESFSERADFGTINKQINSTHSRTILLPYEIQTEGSLLHSQKLAITPYAQRTFTAKSNISPQLGLQIGLDPCSFDSTVLNITCFAHTRVPQASLILSYHIRLP